MVTVVARSGESGDVLARRYKRAVDKSGILTEFRRRATYETRSQREQRRRAAAKKRWAKKLQRLAPQRRDARDRRRRD